jgi:hypothetical protein
MNVNPITSSGTATQNFVHSADSKNNTDFASVLNANTTDLETDLDSIFEEASKKYNVPVKLLKAVAKAESNFNADATSCCGAMGIMQLMPGTAESLGVDDAYDPEQNIMGGAKYLSQLLNELGGDIELAVGAYNAGPGNVEKYGCIPPFEQTRNYVDKVMEYYGSDISANSILTSSNTPSQSFLSTASDTESFSSMLLMSIYQMQLNMLTNTDDEQIGIF